NIEDLMPFNIMQSTCRKRNDGPSCLRSRGAELKIVSDSSDSEDLRKLREDSQRVSAFAAIAVAWVREGDFATAFEIVQRIERDFASASEIFQTIEGGQAQAEALESIAE